MVFLKLSFLGVVTSSDLTCNPGGISRCAEQFQQNAGCSCDNECLERKDCCSDYSTICHGACPSHTKDVFLCRDGSECDPMTHPDAFGCCTLHGGKHKCPSSMPYMCTGINAGMRSIMDCGSDHCCFATPHMCREETIDRSLLQDCPAAVGEVPGICAYNQGPQTVFAPFTPYVGSSLFRLYDLKDAASMEITPTGRQRARTWSFCPAHTKASMILCRDLTECDGVKDGWDCCGDHGSRYKCPAEAPVMCTLKSCGKDREEHCCEGSALSCGTQGALEQCIEPLDYVDAAFGVEPKELVRQCSLNKPVLCTDKSCVETKSECDVETNCPEILTCEAGKFEATPVGHTAFAPCGTKEKPLAGRKYAACVSTFVDGREVATWNEAIVDDCRPVPEKCPPRVIDGDVIPYMPLGNFFMVKKENCPFGNEGVTAYQCTKEKNTTAHLIVSICDLRCNRKEFCSGNGAATTSVQDMTPQLGEPCHCTCDKGFYGKRCEFHHTHRLWHSFLAVSSAVLVFLVALICTRKMRRGDDEVRHTEEEEDEYEEYEEEP